MRRLGFTTVLMSLLVGLFFPLTAAADDYKRGDLNHDGIVNVSDVVALIHFILNQEWPGESQHEWVDLGLPSGTLWATCNIGANAPEEYGDYFAWGETAPKEVYTWSTYKWCNGSETTLTKYCSSSYGYNGFADGKMELDPEDDAAYVNWGSSWRMPTKEQLQELIDNCTGTWTQLNGVNGRLVTGPNGNSLFLPLAGSRSNYSLSNAGSSGGYWSRMLLPYLSSYATDVYFASGSVSWNGMSRFYGFTVRAVYISQN